MKEKKERDTATKKVYVHVYIHMHIYIYTYIYIYIYTYKCTHRDLQIAPQRQSVTFGILSYRNPFVRSAGYQIFGLTMRIVHQCKSNAPTPNPAHAHSQSWRVWIRVCLFKISLFRCVYQATRSPDFQADSKRFWGEKNPCLF